MRHDSPVTLAFAPHRRRRGMTVLISESPASTLSARIPVLDGIRGLAILLVMLHHQTLLESSARLDSLFASIMGMGGSGVDLFFVLSGFLITRILLAAREQPHYFRNFYARRTLRIFPLYYAVVAFSLLVLPMIPHAKAARFAVAEADGIWYWLYLSNFSIAYHGAFRHGILDISWSLAIEEQFYLLWPLIVMLVSPRRLPWLCLALVGISLLSRAALAAAGVGGIPIYTLTFCRMDGLAMGAAIAPLAHTRGSLSAFAPAARRAGLLAGLAFIVAWYGLGDYSSKTFQVIGHTLICLAWSALLIAILQPHGRSITQRLLSGRFLGILGKYSYALYLFHLPIRALIRDTVYGPERFLTIGGSQLPGQMLFYLGSTLLTLAAAWLSWHIYEKHFLALKRYFHAPAGAAPAIVNEPLFKQPVA